MNFFSAILDNCQSASELPICAWGALWKNSEDSGASVLSQGVGAPLWPFSISSCIVPRPYPPPHSMHASWSLEDKD